MTVWGEFEMIRVDLKGGWAMWRVGGATFDSLWWIWDDTVRLQGQVGYEEGRRCYI